MNIVLFDSLSPGGNFCPTSDFRFSHFVNVLKVKEGDSFRCGVWGEGQGSATVTAITDGGIGFDYSPLEVPSTALPLTIVLGAIRPIALKRVIKALSQLGARHLVVFPSVLSEKSYLGANLFRSGEAERANLDGAMLSGNFAKMRITVARNIHEADEVAGPGHRMLLNIGPYPHLLSSLKKGEETIIALGSERGFVKSEIDFFCRSGYESVSLGERILSSEFAAIVSAGLYASLA